VPKHECMVYHFNRFCSIKTRYLKNIGNQTVYKPVGDTSEVNGVQLVTDILQNILFCVHQKKFIQVWNNLQILQPQKVPQRETFYHLRIKLARMRAEHKEKETFKWQATIVTE